MTNLTVSFALSKNAFGHLCLTDQSGKVHDQVVPVRAFPISNPGESIAIVDRDGHELIWLDKLEQASPESQQLIIAEFASREFMPVLTRINAVSTFTTPSTWQVETNRGPTEFTLRGEENIRRINPTTYLIADAHGVQYLIEDIKALDKYSRRLLDRFL